MSPRPTQDPAPRVRAICLALPGASERLSHGEPAFFAGGRMFAMGAHAENHHGNGRHGVWVKAPAGAQETLVEADGRRFFVPPYVGVSGWVGIWLDGRVDWNWVAAIIEEGYRMVASKKLLAQLAVQDQEWSVSGPRA